MGWGRRNKGRRIKRKKNKQQSSHFGVSSYVNERKREKERERERNNMQIGH